MRQVLAVVAGAALAAVGAVVLGEYDLEHLTAVIGFPLYAIAVAEVVLAVARRVAPWAIAATALAVAGGLTWALWISFNHFRNHHGPPALSWAMVPVAAAAGVAWTWSSRGRRAEPPDDAPAPPPATPTTQEGP